MVLDKRRRAQSDLTHPCELFRCRSPSIIHCKIFWFLSRSSSGTCASMLRPLSSPLPGVSDAFLQPRRVSVLPLLLQVSDKKDKHQVWTSRSEGWKKVSGHFQWFFFLSTVFPSAEQTLACDGSKRTCSPCLLACWPPRRQHSCDFWPGLRST